MPTTLPRMKDNVYEEKAKKLVKKLYDPGQFMMEVIGPDKLRTLRKT